MSTRMRSDAQKFTVTNVTYDTTGALVTIPTNCTSILISNTSAVSLKIAFDGGTVFFTIPTLQSLSLDCDNFSNRNTLFAKAASATAAVEFLFGAEL